MRKINDQSHCILLGPWGSKSESESSSEKMIHPFFIRYICKFYHISFSSAWIDCHQNKKSLLFQYSLYIVGSDPTILFILHKKTVNKKNNGRQYNQYGRCVCRCPEFITKSNSCWYHISQKKAWIHFWKVVNNWNIWNEFNISVDTLFFLEICRNSFYFNKMF